MSAFVHTRNRQPHRTHLHYILVIQTRFTKGTDVQNTGRRLINCACPCVKLTSAFIRSAVGSTCSWSLTKKMLLHLTLIPCPTFWGHFRRKLCDCITTPRRTAISHWYGTHGRHPSCILNSLPMSLPHFLSCCCQIPLQYWHSWLILPIKLVHHLSLALSPAQNVPAKSSGP